MQLSFYARVAFPLLLLVVSATLFMAAPFSYAAEPQVGEESIYFLLEDHLGSVTHVLDEEGNVVEQRDYLPYGSERSHIRELDEKESYGFTGQEDDPETGLINFGARYYDALVGRFISLDPVIGTLTNPQSFNKYSYAFNNPFLFIDPTGMYNIKTGAVEKGDTLSGITKELNSHYGTKYSYNDIAKFNNVANPNKISIGQTVRIGAYTGDGGVWQPTRRSNEVTVGHWNTLDMNQKKITHYGRNLFQTDLPSTFKEMAKANQQSSVETGSPAWFRIGKNPTHNLVGASGNIDYRGRGSEAGKQAIYDGSGNLVTSAENMGTFDFGTPGTEAHKILDVTPWLEWGNSPYDTTTGSDRIDVYKRALNPLNYY